MSRNRCEFGTKTFEASIVEPVDEGVEIPAIQEVNVFESDSKEGIQYLNTGQSIVVKFMAAPVGSQPVEITAPKNVRNLYIICDSYYDIILNCADNKGLERISVGNCNFAGFSGGGCSKITITGNLDGLKGCTNLKEIYIEGAGLTDISGLADCDKLEILYFNNNGIMDISVLADKENLKEVQLEGNGTKNMYILDEILN